MSNSSTSSPRTLERMTAGPAFGVPMGTAVIIVEKGDNRIILDKGANGQLTESDIDKALEKVSGGRTKIGAQTNG